VYIDMFVFKANSAGNVQWARRGGTSGDDDAGRSIAADEAGNVYVAGEVRASGNFDGLTYSGAGFAEAYVAKYNTAGAIQYLTLSGGSGGDYAYGIAANSTSVYFTGLFNGTAQFGPVTLVSAGINDIYLAKMDAASGAITHAIRAGGAGDDAGRAVDIISDSLNIVVQGGDFEHTPSTFAPFALTSSGSHDMFASQVNFDLTTDVSENVEELNGFSVYPNPTHDVLNVKCKVQNSKLTLYDVTGRPAYTATINTGHQILNLSLAPGIYFVKLTAGERVYTEKIVIE